MWDSISKIIHDSSSTLSKNCWTWYPETWNKLYFLERSYCLALTTFNLISDLNMFPSSWSVLIFVRLPSSGGTIWSALFWTSNTANIGSWDSLFTSKLETWKTLLDKKIGKTSGKKKKEAFYDAAFRTTVKNS